MLNRFAAPPKNVVAFLESPIPQYIPVGSIDFGPNQVVMPYQLPPSSMVFPNPTFNKMLNIPAFNVQTVYQYQRTGRMSV